MHTHYAKEQGLLVTSARLLCKMPLLSILLLAFIANGIGQSHRLRQEAVIMHKEICHFLLAHKKSKNQKINKKKNKKSKKK